jgi:hypothetical protein
LEPLAGLLVTSRKDLAKDFDRYMDRTGANLRLPVRQVDWQAAADSPALLSPRAFIRSQIVEVATPSYQRTHEAVEMYLGHRDGILVAIGLELYRRQHGRYPERLDQLIPAHLSEAPADRITGNAVRYRLVDGRPVVYSVGADRDDDSGRPAIAPAGYSSTRIAAQWGSSSVPPGDGDWRLYPQPGER